MSTMGKSFADAIKIGEMVENGLKTGMIMSQARLKATSQAIQNSPGSVANWNKWEEGAMMASRSRGIRRVSSRSYIQLELHNTTTPIKKISYVVASLQYVMMNAKPYARPPI